MTAKKTLSTMFILLALVALMIATSCQSASPISAQAAAPKARVKAEFDYERAAEVNAYRWQAMAEAYERQGKLNTLLSADELTAYRWQAMAEAYERQGKLNTRLSADELTAYRWQAMAEAYERQGKLNTRLSADELTAYRWQAMAEAYARRAQIFK